MFIIALPLLVCVIGLLMYALAANPKVVEIGRIMFWTGLLATMLAWPGAHVLAATPHP